MRIILRILVTYFTLCIFILIALQFDWSADFFFLLFFLLPIFWFGRLLEPLMTSFGFWIEAGPSTWVNYDGPAAIGLYIICFLGFIISLLLLRRLAHKSKK
jgi:hypothetical protein